MRPPSCKHPEPVGRPRRGQPGDRLVGRKEPLTDCEPSQEPRRRPVQPRVGLDPEDRVRADQLEPVRGDSPHSLLGRVVLEHCHVQLGFAQEIEHELDRLDPRSAASSASVRPAVLSFGGAAFATTMRSGPTIPNQFSHAGRPCSMSCAIRRRSSSLRRRASVADAPPSCAQAGSSARSTVEPAPYGYWSKEIDVVARLVEQIEQRLDQALVGEPT